MKHYQALLMALTLCSTVVAAPFSAVPAAAAGSYDMNVHVDLSSSGKAISPYIYGVNMFGNESNMKKLTAHSTRQGGNRMTAYNWENNASNAGSDWQHSSDDNLSKSNDPGDCVQTFSKQAQDFGIDYKLTTVQLAGYVAADKNGTVSEEEAAPSDRWDEVVLTKGSDFSMTPDLTDGKVYMDEYVNFIVQTLGDASSPTGMQAYSLDNEPALWNHTHSRMHPQPVGVTELRDKSVEMAKRIKAIDPKAEVFGPALYGYTAFDHLSDDDNNHEWETLKAQTGYHWYLDYYLDEMSKASTEAGTRLLDVLDIHYYSESARVGAEDRLQSVRTLYEKDFAENSWIGQYCQENIPILPTIQKSIDTYYPGTKLAISEYNFGGEDDVSGAIAQAEALGCYADAGVYYAAIWGGGGYIFSGLNLYTNYDGNGGCFGDTLIPATTQDVSLSSTYAAVNAGDTSEVTVMVTNKSATDAENLTISLDGAQKDYQSAAVYAVSTDSTDIHLIDIADVKDAAVNVTLPAYCAAMIVVSDDANAFDGLDIYDPNVKTERSVVFDDPMSMVGSDDFIEIPIEDPEHLVRIEVTADVVSTLGSSWGTAGCEICANVEDANGEGFWSYKDYTLGLGTGVTAKIEFDGTFGKPTSDDPNAAREDVPATVADGKVQLQQWWESSEKKQSDQDPADLTVTYTKVEVFYSLDGQGTEALRGDVNADGIFNIADAVALCRYLSHDEAVQVWTSGDFDGNGALDSTDLTMMKRALAEYKD